MALGVATYWLHIPQLVVGHRFMRTIIRQYMAGFCVPLSAPHDTVLVFLLLGDKGYVDFGAGQLYGLYQLVVQVVICLRRCLL